MNGQQSMYCLLSFILGVVIVVLASLYHSAYQTEQFVKGGYVECMLPGSNMPRWCKQ